MGQGESADPPWVARYQQIAELQGFRLRDAVAGTGRPLQETAAEVSTEPAFLPH
jgi:hypothetical protein